MVLSPPYWAGPGVQGGSDPARPQELDSLRHQVDQLVEENVELELELQRSLEPPPGSPGECEWSPVEGPGLGAARVVGMASDFIPSPQVSGGVGV